MKRTIVWLALAGIAAAGLAAAASRDDLTTDNIGRAAFNQPFAFIKDDALARFRLGSSIFRQPWLMTQSEDDLRFGGLGPLSNRLSCIGCHIGNGRGETSSGETDLMRSTLVRLSMLGAGVDGGPLPEPVYGDQLQTAGIVGVSGEGEASIRWQEFEQILADGTQVSLRRPELLLRNLHYGPMSPKTMTSVRMSPTIFGLGLLAAVPDAELLARADPDDADHDGVRGRINHVWNVERARSEIGRFGLKSNQPTLRQQVAGALIGDLGITSQLFMQQNCTQAETDCIHARPTHNPEIDDDDLATLVSYVEAIAPPARRAGDASAARGETLFGQTGCVACHAPTLTTGAASVRPQLANREIHPYTDILLHDMGEGLADGRPDFEASGRDWRTTPLWGIGLASAVSEHPAYLHDGRARNLTEAILWHGGEASHARDSFAALPATDRDAVIAFLNSL